VTLAPVGQGRIAFVRELAENDHAQIFVMNPDGTDQVNISKSREYDYFPSWSPDGTQIAFDRGSRNDVFVMNADGTNQRNLTDRRGNDYWPEWSPLGDKILFGSERDGNAEIYVMNADGTGQTNLTNTDADEILANWSPDGLRIVYSRFHGDQAELWIMNADGSGRTRLTETNRSEVNAAFSPEGTLIAFSFELPNTKEHVALMNVDGSAVTELASIDDGWDPAWSPDGQMLVAGAWYGDEGLGEIIVLNANDSELVNLTNSPLEEYQPDWGPDS
jgi:TolB protein